MSISPSKHQPKPLSPQSISKKNKPEAPPLSLFQALTITAGMAGLIGLVSGAVIRFFVTNSPTASFLSPIQTFPTSSNWAADSSQTKSSNLDLLLDNSDAPITDQDSAGSPISFDQFATRSQYPSQFIQDPLERLRRGPLLSETASFDSDDGDIAIPELEDPAFEPYFEADAESGPFFE